MRIKDQRALSHIGASVLFAALAVACGGESPTNTGPSASTIDPKDNPHGYPMCGSDPKNQPSPCIDDKAAVHCKANSGYPGDELALCDVDASEGTLIHMGPTDYADPEALKPWILPAGGEEEFCQHTTSTNADMKYFTTYHGRMRPHSHHWIVTAPSQPTAPEAAPYVCPPITAVIDRWLFGSQSAQIDVQRLTGGALEAKPGDPDYGLAHDFPPNQTILMDLHYVNSTSEPILREAWAALKWVDPADVKQKTDLLSWINGSINIPPMGHYVTPRSVCTNPSTTDPVYLGLATAHAHQRMIRTTLYHTAVDGTETVVYETHNWHEAGEAYFRDGAGNPPLPIQTGQDWGAVNQFLKVLPGETVSFECEFQNDQNHTVTFGDTTKDEMCNIFGFYYPTVGGMWHC